jgi:hypothetical protein
MELLGGQYASSPRGVEFTNGKRPGGGARADRSRRPILLADVSGSLGERGDLGSARCCPGTPSRAGIQDQHRDAASGDAEGQGNE